MPTRAPRCGDCTVTTITAWHEVYVENGVVYAVFWSGNVKHAMALGPSLALQGIELAKRALAQGSVTPLVRRKRVAAPGAH